MAYDNLLKIVSDFVVQSGVSTPPTTVTGSNDDTITQMWGLLNEGLRELGLRKWSPTEAVKVFSYTLPTVLPAADDPAAYLAMDLRLALPDYQGMAQDTFYTQTTRIPCNGPVPEDQWAEMITMQVSAAQYNYRFWRTGLYIYPYPPSATPVPFSFRYITNYSVLNTDTGVSLAQNQFGADTDFSLIPSEILTQDLRYRWKREKGMDWQAALQLRDAMVAAHFNQIGNQAVIDMGDYQMPGISNPLIGPGLYISAGNTVPT